MFFKIRSYSQGKNILVDDLSKSFIRYDRYDGSPGGSSQFSQLTLEVLPPNIPPIVTGTYPADNDTDIPTNTSIIITFSKSMDKIATEGAILANPVIIGAFSWDTAAEVVTWNLTQNLTSSTSYTIKISTAAKSVDGINLTTQHEFTFTTQMVPEIVPPKVVTTSPTNNATNIDEKSQIIITFSKAMDKDATNRAVSISPGSIISQTWNNASTVLVVSATLADGTKYTVTITTDARDSAGNKLTATYTFSFTTIGSPANDTSMTLYMIALIVLDVVLLTIVIILSKRKRKTRSSEEVRIKTIEKQKEAAETKKKREGTREKQTERRSEAITSIRRHREQAP